MWMVGELVGWEAKEFMVGLWGPVRLKDVKATYGISDFTIHQHT